MITVPVRQGKRAPPKLCDVASTLRYLENGHSLGVYIKRPRSPGWINARADTEAPNRTVPRSVLTKLMDEGRLRLTWSGHHTARYELVDVAAQGVNGDRT